MATGCRMPALLQRKSSSKPQTLLLGREVTTNVRPPQKFNTKGREKQTSVFPWSVLGQHTACLHQNHQLCAFPLGLSMKWPNYPRFLILEPTQINSAAASHSAEANPSEQLCNLFLTKGAALSKLHSSYSVYKDMVKMCILTFESGTQNSPCSHQDHLNWPFLI